MCLAVPARILSIRSQPPAGEPGPGPPTGADDGLWRMAEVDFGGVRQQVSLACLPEAAVGDRVLVHVGLALSLVEDDPA
ncbi:HypC/HybG/HupF family hydrogenase formation chaperone [Cyanobium gracile UHCC 0139]|uniref:HypC/HybG/HupF family hydrogenase formation chaperone n=1 Tax=Cyanobium gracile UHCC 0139 TaxID=3110308 RepID=A0ABU5RW51_9CYAN|nr:HypC/HybG/HupF family hydrogenase formation chaperone [Cyanobium gracile]MEA5391948.1 HypC/HybG/HupF family hydrogenase formation chaperone [Cyanobium gracile UHCC 0139]